MTARRVYLAGPDVFLPDAEVWLARKKAICARADLAAVTPLDPLPGEPQAWSALPEWRSKPGAFASYLGETGRAIQTLLMGRSPGIYSNRLSARDHRDDQDKFARRS